MKTIYGYSQLCNLYEDIDSHYQNTPFEELTDTYRSYEKVLRFICNHQDEIIPDLYLGTETPPIFNYPFSFTNDEFTTAVDESPLVDSHIFLRFVGDLQSDYKNIIEQHTRNWDDTHTLITTVEDYHELRLRHTVNSMRVHLQDPYTHTNLRDRLLAIIDMQLSAIGLAAESSKSAKATP